MSDPASLEIRDADGEKINFVRNPDPAKGAKQDEANELLATVLVALAAVKAAVDGIQPASSAEAVSPSDTVNLSGVRALFVGTGGNLNLTMGGQNVSLLNVPDGTTLPIAATKVRLGTTASNIVAFK